MICHDEEAEKVGAEQWRRIGGSKSQRPPLGIGAGVPDIGTGTRGPL